MNKNISDDQLDAILTAVTRDVCPDDQTIGEIADSPSLWWSVQREIRNSEVKASGWLALRGYWRWLLAATPVAVVAIVAGFMMLSSEEGSIQKVAELDRPEAVAPADHSTTVGLTALANVPPPVRLSVSPSPDRTTRAVAYKKKSLPHQLVASRTKQAEEIRSDFIQLSYASAPASGQIVRVKVPQAMMVSLGLVASVEKPTNLVDAEVVVGDDGMTHAIRFIRGQ